MKTFDRVLAQGKYIEDTMNNIFTISRQYFIDFIQENCPAAASSMESWQEYLEKTASFVKKIEIREENLCTD